MAEFITKCPHCQNDLQVEDGWIGIDVDCPLCSKTFTVQKSPAERLKNNSRTSSTHKCYCSNCKKEYSNSVKFCSECGSEIKTKSSNGAKKSTQSDNSEKSKIFYDYFGLVAILIGVPVLLTIWIDWPRTIFWCTIPLWGGCLAIFEEINRKLQILLFVVIICWGWWAHTRVEIPTTGQAKESKQIVKIASQAPAATSAQANNTSNIAEKKSPPLEFSGISVNESEANIRAYFRNKRWHYNSQEDTFHGRLWSNDTRNKDTDVKIDSGKIIVTFSLHQVELWFLGKSELGLWDMETKMDEMVYKNQPWKNPNAEKRDKILKKACEHLLQYYQINNSLAEKYFEELQKKYGKAQVIGNRKIIKLKDGLIESEPIEERVLKDNERVHLKYTKIHITFYNRQAAQKRLSEI